MLNASKIKGGEGGRPRAEALEDGSYPGVLTGVIDLGVQKRDAFQGQEKLPCPHIMFTYAFLDEFVKDEDGNETQDARLLSEKMGLFSLKSDRSKSTQRYRVFDPDFKYAGYFGDCVGVPVNISVKRKVSKTTKRAYNVVDTVSPMRAKDVKKFEAEIDEAIGKYGIVFDLEEPTKHVWNKLFDWQKDIIQSGVNVSNSFKSNVEKWANGEEADEPVVDNDVQVESDDVVSPY